ncbi:MAG TPA: hypothetical protein VJL90_01680 [Pseudorhodoplanes sp.]|nr:hypothetical protein [Pseudorhodoplanes sp.]
MSSSFTLSKLTYPETWMAGTSPATTNGDEVATLPLLQSWNYGHSILEGIVKAIFIALALTLFGIVMSGPFNLSAQAKTAEECRAESYQKYPAGTRSKADRERAIQACVGGGSIGDVKAKSSGSSTPCNQRGQSECLKCCEAAGRWTASQCANHCRPR